MDFSNFELTMDGGVTLTVFAWIVATQIRCWVSDRRHKRMLEDLNEKMARLLEIVGEHDTEHEILLERTRDM